MKRNSQNIYGWYNTETKQFAYTVTKNIKPKGNNWQHVSTATGVPQHGAVVETVHTGRIDVGVLVLVEQRRYNTWSATHYYKIISVETK